MLYHNRKIVNLSLAPPCREMRLKGVFELPTVQRLEFQSMVTFSGGSPIAGMVDQNAFRIAAMAHETGAQFALIDVPAFMVSSVERELLSLRITPMYPWGEVYRYSVESEIDAAPSIRCAYKVLDLIEVTANGKKEAVGS